MNPVVMDEARQAATDALQTGRGRRYGVGVAYLGGTRGDDETAHTFLVTDGRREKVVERIAMETFRLLIEHAEARHIVASLQERLYDEYVLLPRECDRFALLPERVRFA